MNVGKIKLTQLNRTDALRYMGYGTREPDSQTSALLDKCERELLRAIDGKYVYRVFSLTDGQIPDSKFRLDGYSVKKHLQGCTKVIFLCATLSDTVDRLIRIKQISAMAEAIVVDALASAAVEQVCDLAENEILQEFPNLEHTWRFGLGYGDFPLTGQSKFLDILDAPKRIGVCVNESLLLTPTKSVTCVIGLGNELPKDSIKSCDMCSLGGKCTFRLNGGTCQSH
jgi:5-methyltetrahydrofolate--homocysteine methyltransferase